ncbi:MAG: hypothetical protein JWM11_5588 [Planctomycetaceae bacterium]|nr:hypothetical protein [Planctomycetaceae bacterium]
MSSSRIDLKNPVLATILAWLVPGLGHAYQGRWFKAALYSVCIWSTFGCGWVLGDGKVVYYNTDLKRGRRPIGYAAQVLVGVASLPALLQTSRATPRDIHQFSRDSIPLERPLSGEFEGWLIDAEFPGGRGNFKFRGQISIEPSPDATFVKSVTGKLKGTISKADELETNIPDGSTIELTIDYLRSLEPAIYPSSDRELQCEAKGQLLGANGGELKAGVKGKILNVRSIWNRYAAPLDAEGLEETHGDLGKFFEIGLVYTWIAGLLNLLAMWDAYEGPAYGYGDEEPAGPTAAPPDVGAGTATPESTTANHSTDIPPPVGEPQPTVVPGVAKV